MAFKACITNFLYTLSAWAIISTVDSLYVLLPRERGNEMPDPHNDAFIRELQKLSEKYESYKKILDPIIEQLKKGNKSQVAAAIRSFRLDPEWN